MAKNSFLLLSRPLLILLIPICFSSCSKDEPDNSMRYLTELSNSISFNELSTGRDFSSWEISITGFSYMDDMDPNSYFIKVSWKANESTSNWQEKQYTLNELFMSHSSITLEMKDLLANTNYLLKVEVYNPKGEKMDVKATNFTTKPFSIDYEKLYPYPHTSDYGGLIGALSTLSLESGVHTLYGFGFRNVPLTINFTSQVDPSDHFSIEPTILNDSILTFKIPNDVIPNDPYIVGKRYTVKVNELPLLNLFPYFDHKNNPPVYGLDTRDPGTFNIINKDLVINDVEITPSALKNVDVYSFKGHFGPIANDMRPNSEYILGVPINPRKATRFEIKSGNTVITNLLAQDSKAKSQLWRDENLFPYGFYFLQSSAGYQFNLKLAAGNYSAQYIGETADGKHVVSNEYNFSVK